MRTSLILASIVALVLAAPGIAASAVSEPELVSHDDAGTAVRGLEPSVSDDGTRVAYASDYLGTEQPSIISVLDRTTGKNIFSQKVSPGTLNEFDLSGDGRHLVVRTWSTTVIWYDIDTGDARLLPVRYAVMTQPYISADGQLVSFSATRDVREPEHAQLWNVQSDEITQITAGGRVFAAQTSGDGRTIAYHAHGHTYARRIGTDGWIRVDALPSGKGLDGQAWPTGISHSGNYVLFTSKSTMGGIPDACNGRLTGSCVWRKKLIDDRQLKLANMVDGVVAPVPSEAAESDLSADGRVATYATMRGYVRAYRFSTDTNVHVSLNSDGGGRPVHGVSTTRTGSAVAYSLDDDEVFDEPTAWITETGN